MVDLRKHSSLIATVFVMLMMFVYMIEWLRVGIGRTMDMVLGPLVNTPPDGFGVPFFAMILILSCITGLYSSLVQKYTIDYERMQRVQKNVREFQKEYREAQLSGDEKKIKKLEGRRDKMMQEQMEMSKQQFQPMAIILVLTIPIFLWMLYRLPAAAAAAVTDLNLANAIVLPFIGLIGLSATAFWFVPAWILWYMICSLSMSQVIRKALNIGGL
ncbi:MAG: DUF106 domain-containing protein [Methanomicrobiaceae archaeon]|uniref:DUF106 domain-containing protein n=1 Tax=hydrocarbon metagenome TaxID=938273 RepID=A0A0W8FHQ6_9ZZZZ|nr:DUF106 domain-containing protein [Methanomicrobiaceae archaeon]MDD5418288.1 EMC3/TMCO1 family protein [Methanomicrobiaceae archaeon]